MSASAAALPMPVPAPVTTATFTAAMRSPLPAGKGRLCHCRFRRIGRRTMRTLLTCLLLAAVPAMAQAPAVKDAIPKTKACAECGVVRAVRSVTRETRTGPIEEARDAKPSGLVASIPLGGGKPEVGSSTKVGKDAVPTVTMWEVVVRLDDGRITILTLNEDPDLREGDKVRIDKGKPVRRTD